MPFTFTRRAILAAATACTSLGLSLATPADAAENVLTVAWPQDIFDWDPAKAAGVEQVLFPNIYDLLVWADPDSEEQFRPGLATEWSVDESGLVWTFKIREGVKCHDGTDFTAEDAKVSIERNAAGPVGFIWAAVEKAEAPDDYTLVLTTKYPANMPLFASSSLGAYMFSSEATDEDFTEAKASFGTGPYMLRQHLPDQQLVIDRFPDYWGGPLKGGGFDRIVHRIAKEASTRIQLLSSGEADLAFDIPTDQIESVSAGGDVKAVSFPTWQMGFWYVNNKIAPTDNIHVRRAIQHLWDRKTVSEGIYNGYTTPAIGPLAASQPGAVDLNLPDFSIEAAKAELAESGLSSDELKITVAYFTQSDEMKNDAVLFQANAAQAGLTVELTPNDWGTLWAAAQDERTASNMLSMFWGPIISSPADLLYSAFYSEEKLFNLSMYQSDEYDAKLLEAMSIEATDIKAGQAAYADAMRILVQDAAAVWDQDLNFVVGYRADLNGVGYNPAYSRAIFFDPITE
ncbi:ABC transporter substrate-binding protein [Defluviimonas salinarum]|uniref:ABC transporter substrate-binding protein n=1 Tax=Defluviimonas salinarum TaxID=2992147 RepID=A0ABT3J7H0_9RHOB|nr:ABC transporter substrate-binding protein [Defluviimonas salinarum]MCW3783632.1 ABC transporter substrate-binding protein [Defluviimonas salinarum]